MGGREGQCERSRQEYGGGARGNTGIRVKMVFGERAEKINGGGRVKDYRGISGKDNG